MPSLPPPRVTELYYGGQWTNISGDMRESTPVTITRGVSAEGARSDPGTATALLDNRSGDYSPRDPNCRLYGEVGRNTPWRFGVQAGPPWVDLPGAAGDALVTPDHAALGVAGDLDVRVDVVLNDWRRPQLFAARYHTVAEDRSWGLMLEGTGKLLLVWSSNGTIAARKWVASTVPVPVPDWHAPRLTVRAVLDIDNGAAGNTVTFYTARHGYGWEQLGAPVVTAGTTSVFDGIAPLELGDSVWLQTLPAGTAMYSLAGKVYGLQLRDGAALKVNMVFDTASAGASTATDTTGLTWTTTGGASLSNLHTRMEGEVPAWPPSRDLSGNDRTVSITPAGIMRRLGAGNRPLDSAIRRYMLGSNALECWPLTDGQQATRGAALRGSPPVIAAGKQSPPLWGQGSVADWIEPVLQFPDQKNGILTATPGSVGTATWSVDHVRSGAGLSEVIEVHDRGRGTESNNRTIWRVYTQAVPNQILIFRETVAADSSSTAFLDTVADPGIFDSRPHHIRFSTTVSGGSTAWNLYIDGALRAAGVEALAGQALGRIEYLWDLDAPEAGDLSLGYLTCWSNTGPSASAVYQAVMGFPGETAGARMQRLSTENGVAISVSGEDAYQTRLGIQRPEKYLDSLSTIAKADLGYLIERRDARELAYRARVTLYNQVPVITLRYTDGVISAPFKPLDDDKLSENDVSVTRDGGTTARAVLETGRMSVQDPPDGIGRYDVDYKLSLEADHQTDEHAQWRMHTGTVDGLRYTKITLNLANARVYAMISDIYRADIGDLIRLTDLPADHGPGPVDLIIRGYTEEIGADAWTLTFNCVPGQPWTVGVADDPVVGRADTDGSQLVAAVTTAATTLSVASTAGPAWVTDPMEYPFDLTVGGEVVTVVAAGQVINPNPLLLTGDTTGWLPASASLAYSTTIVNTARGATGSILLTPAGGASAVGLNAEPHSAVGTITPGASYTMSGWVYSPLGWADMRIVTDWYTAADVLISTSPSVAVAAPAGVWTYITLTATAPALASRSRVRGRQGLTPTAADISYWWAVRLVPDASVSTTSPQTMTVVRSVNGIVKAHTAGTPLSLTHPMRAAL
ncbi:hypothetical protein [Streptomyces sp. NPDC058620]|uniref:hypothetical protein n=1 Tax=Streptomyces sp. NPDC058620 TaxID=3346560 RepID=UPI003667ACB2